MSKDKKSHAVSLHANVEQILDWNNPESFRPDDFEPADKKEKEDFIQSRPSTSYWQDAWRRLKQNKVAMVALVVIILLILFAFIGPYFTQYSYEQQIRGSENLKPFEWSEEEQARIDQGEKLTPHPFGTDGLGRDIMVRTMFGTRVSITIGVVAALIVLVIGSLYGSISGYFGGRLDTIMMRFAELIYSIPEMLVVLLLAVTLKPGLTQYINEHNNGFSELMGSLGPSLISIFITFGLIYWVSMSRIIRGQVLMLKEQEYVTAARALGASSGRIIRKHLLPNCMGQIIVTTMLQIPSAIFLESFLSFLGVGVSAPMTSLGSLAADALGGMYSYTYRLIIPAIFLSILILSFNLFGDGLRDALDPRLKK